MWIYDNVVDCVCSGAAVAVPNLGQTPLVQQFYVSRALLLCVGLLRHPELQELRSENDNGRFVMGFVHVDTPCWKSSFFCLVPNDHDPGVLSPVRAAAVHAGKDAEPPGQQRSACETHGHGGGEVSPLLQEHQRTQAQIRGAVKKWNGKATEHDLHRAVEDYLKPAPGRAGSGVYHCSLPWWWCLPL
ncbi:uncharacterized protein LOC115191511 isoform X1 [Salmo trutta]|uniref:uncharacterized protein LOC115191511 isoform X1 n=1 Tax=Salmo trutta TaxID=8032 RepID=UPI001130CA89|nr:uncharacterized protein LOC115191511 isoform X1 [Salmo trutta]